MRLSVDRGDGFVDMSPEQFFALPLSDRIGVVLQTRIRFYDEASNPVPLMEGLKFLRDQAPAHLRG